MTLKEFLAQFSEKLQQEVALEVALAKTISRVTEPIKAIDLMLKLSKNDPETPWLDIIELAVKNGELKELEYILPDMDYRVKSMLFPKGTELRT